MANRVITLTGKDHPGRGTKERVLDTALGLFNARGTRAVSTNHIAKALNISPGNLYYHYRNKEDIVRALFERLSDEWHTLYTLPEDRAPTLTDLDGMLRGHFQALWRYRFFYREMVALTQRDPGLRARYRRERDRGYKNFVRLVNAFVRGGVLRMPDGPGAITELAHGCWVVAEFWLPFAELGGARIGQRRLEEGVRVLRRILQPYVRGASR